MDTDLIVYIKPEHNYSEISKDVKTGFDTSNYELKRPVPKMKNKKVIGLMKNERIRKIMAEFTAWRPKTYGYLIDGNKEK